MKPEELASVQPDQRRRTMCGICDLVAVRMVRPTLSPAVYFGECARCGKPTMQREVGGEVDPEPTPPIVLRPTPEELEGMLGPGERFLIGEGLEISRAEALAALESGEDGGTIRSLGGEGEYALEGDPSICPECGEVGQHDAGCPFPGRLHQAYLRWRETADGELVVDAIRRRALELRKHGFTRYGIQALAEVARFDHALRVGPDAAGYKVNNSHLSRLARDLMRESELLEGFFETRELRSVR